MEEENIIMKLVGVVSEELEGRSRSNIIYIVCSMLAVKLFG